MPRNKESKGRLKAGGGTTSSAVLNRTGTASPTPFCSTPRSKWRPRTNDQSPEPVMSRPATAGTGCASRMT